MSDTTKPDAPETNPPKGATSENNVGMWIGAGVGAGIGSAALAAALLYATRNRNKKSRGKD